MPGSSEYSAYSAFTGTETRRAEASQRRLEGRLVRAREVAAAFGKRLYAEFMAEEVILFGSLLHPERFTHRSDIDLAVRGVTPDGFLQAYGLGIDCDIPVDLVDLSHEALRPEILRRIVQEGQRLER